MPIATLTFNLPEEDYEHRLAVDAWKWREVVSDMTEEFRRVCKNGHNFKSADEAIDGMKALLWAKINEENLSLDG